MPLDPLRRLHCLVRWATLFSVFAIEWEQNVIRWYVDNTLYSTTERYPNGRHVGLRASLLHLAQCCGRWNLARQPRLHNGLSAAMSVDDARRQHSATWLSKPLMASAANSQLRPKRLRRRGITPQQTRDQQNRMNRFRRASAHATAASATIPTCSMSDAGVACRAHVAAS